MKGLNSFELCELLIIKMYYLKTLLHILHFKYKLFTVL